MLTNMAKIISSPASHACQAQYCRHGVPEAFRLPRRFSSVFRTEQRYFYGPNTSRQRELDLIPSFRSSWSSGFIFGPFARRAFSKISHFADISTRRDTWGEDAFRSLENGVQGRRDVSIAVSRMVVLRLQASSPDTHPKSIDERKGLVSRDSLSTTEPLKVESSQMLSGSRDRLLKAILYEAQRGFVNVTGKSQRFGDFLVEQITVLADHGQVGFSSESRDTFRQLAQDSRVYEQMEEDDRISLLNRVARSLGFDSLQDLLDHGSTPSETQQGLKSGTEGIPPVIPTSAQHLEEKQAPEETPVSVVSTPLSLMHPGIMFGSSQPVELSAVGGQSTSSTSPQVVESSTEALKTSSPVPAKARKITSVKKIKKSVSKLAVSGKAGLETKSDQGGSVLKIDGKSIKAPKRPTAKDNWGVDMPMSSMKGLSSYLRSRLEENGFVTMRMLLQHYPRMYRNFQAAGQRVEDGQHLSFVGAIVQSKGSPRGSSLGMTEVVVRSEVEQNGTEDSYPGAGDISSNDVRAGRIIFLHLKKFYRGSRYASSWFLNAMANKFPVGSQVTVCGKVKAMHQPDHFEIREYNLELWDEEKDISASELTLPESDMSGKPYPVYSAKGGLQSKTIEFCIQRVLTIIPADVDPVAEEFRQKWDIQELGKAYIGIHSPQDTADAELARQRLVFDEFFYLQLGMLLPRQELAGKYLAAAGMGDPALVSKSGILSMENWSPLTLKFVKSLPYTLTESQIKAAGEIMWDLQRPVPMNRLLQGDVGCGKTVVAFLALLEVVDAGYQGALMAPTEFLAAQHYQRITSWLEELDENERPRVALLSGSIPVSKARVIRSGFESGEIQLAVGTHSLIADSVKFSALGLGVIDEQHRFGVAQRGRLNNKIRDGPQLPEGVEGDVRSTVLPPHVLAMSATPIPRTLALAMHGDMALSQITELPPGRPETATYAILGDKKGREEVYQRVRAELESGGQVFIVYPVIEESEELPDVRAAEGEFKNLELEFRGYNCGLVHGRMRSHEKDEAMVKFKAGETKVLVSTTVIEVGIDIPEASMIVIEHAERYGMAQLHQLRGRVGRGTRDSTCILLASRSSSLERLKMLESSRDGFYLAEIDLKLRGPGDLLGKQQSGYLPEFHIARLEKDGEILEKARVAAEELLQLHPTLEGLPRIRQELSMRRPPSALS
ncbi:hypothetical protein R1sor_006657 [Riccia sorocarpa]|uniref:DNA helicase n=1 Tax=Riccia sorocarpa TaxID=122646 RepID=A0ABD3HQB4_9MARC